MKVCETRPGDHGTIFILTRNEADMSKMTATQFVKFFREALEEAFATYKELAEQAKSSSTGIFFDLMGYCRSGHRDYESFSSDHDRWEWLQIKDNDLRRIYEDYKDTWIKNSKGVQFEYYSKTGSYYSERPWVKFILPENDEEELINASKQHDRNVANFYDKLKYKGD